MAESERLRGSRSPVVNYKVGDGSIRDLFRYIVGEDLVVKKIRPKRKQTTVNNKEDKVRVKETITSAVNTIFAAKERRYNQGGTKFSQPVPFGDPNSNIYGPQKSATARHNIRGSVEAGAPNPFGADSIQDDRGPTATVGSVAVEDLPPTIRASEGPMKVRPHRGYDRLAMQGENVVGRSGQPRRQSPVESYQRGVSRPETMTPEEVELERKMRENPDFFYGGDPETKIYGRDRSDIIMTPPGGGMAYGGKVSTPKKKRKKRLSKGGKVTSYNY
jgi:hypothetical protein